MPAPDVFHRLAVAASTLLVVAGCNTAPAPTPAVKGKAHFENYCAPCHGEQGHGSNPQVGAPAIAGLPEWYVERQLTKYRNGMRGDHAQDIEGYRMRPMSLALRSERAVGEVSEYVSKLPAVYPARTFTEEEASAEKGKSLYGTCTACHGANALGQEALGAPPLTRTHDWYLARQLYKFKRGARAYDEGDTWGATMVPMATGLADEQAMRDVTAYILTLRK